MAPKLTDYSIDITIATIESRMHDPAPITKGEWIAFLRYATPAAPTYTVHLVQEEDRVTWWVHCPTTGADADLGKGGLYRAAMRARVIHPDAEIVLP